jgi:tetratricopeptide (TPR) repeat protein
MTVQRDQNFPNKKRFWKVAIILLVALYLSLITAIFIVQRKRSFLQNEEHKPQPQARQSHVPLATENHSYQPKEAQLKKTLELNPKDIPAHQKLSQLYYQQGKTSQAIAQYQKILALHPDDTEVHLILGRLYMAQTVSQSQALHHLQKVRALQPEHPQSKIIELWIGQLQKAKKKQ